MTWRRLGEKPLSEPMMVSLPTQLSSEDLISSRSPMDIHGQLFDAHLQEFRASFQCSY